MYRIGKYLLKALLWCFSLLPLKVHYFNAGILAWLLRDVVKYRRDDVVVNLSRCFPSKQYAEIKELSKQFYRHFAELMVEAIWFGGCGPKRLHRSHIVEIKNPRTINTLYENAPSVMVMYSHAGNWELYGGVASYNYTTTPTYFKEDNFCVIYRRMHSRVWDEIMRDNRFAPLEDRTHFPGYLESKAFIRYVLSHRGEKKFYNVNTDQRPYYSGSDAIEVEFMGQTCRTMSGSAAVARKMGMAVCFLSMKRVSKGHYTMEYIPICEDASKMEVVDIMKEYYRLLENDINEQPSNYLWTHHRWWRG